MLYLICHGMFQRHWFRNTKPLSTCELKQSEVVAQTGSLYGVLLKSVWQRLMGRLCVVALQTLSALTYLRTLKLLKLSSKENDFPRLFRASKCSSCHLAPMSLCK